MTTRRRAEIKVVSNKVVNNKAVNSKAGRIRVSSSKRNNQPRSQPVLRRG